MFICANCGLGGSDRPKPGPKQRKAMTAMTTRSTAMFLLGATLGLSACDPLEEEITKEETSSNGAFTKGEEIRTTVDRKGQAFGADVAYVKVGSAAPYVGLIPKNPAA